jgi:hypothetical protein
VARMRRLVPRSSKDNENGHSWSLRHGRVQTLANALSLIRQLVVPSIALSRIKGNLDKYPHCGASMISRCYRKSRLFGTSRLAGRISSSWSKLDRVTSNMPDLAIDGLNLEKSIGRYLSEQNWDKDHRLSERTSEESIRKREREREREP